MKVLFFAQNGPLIPASRTRVFAYLPFLKAAGVHCDVITVVPDRFFVWSRSGWGWRRWMYYLCVVCRGFLMGFGVVWKTRCVQVVVIQRVLLPALPAWWLRRYRFKVVFDFDDAIFTTEHAEQGFVQRLRAWQHQKAMPRMLKAASHVIVENRYTQHYALTYCPRVSIITGPIDTDRYAPLQKEVSESVVLGWIGSPSTTQYLNEILKPLSELGRRYPHLSLCLIGAGEFDVPGLSVKHIPWSLETEVANLNACDIGLMPLPDDPWTRGKGGYKLLQYLSMGLPVVASPVEINREIVRHGTTGFLAETPEDWVVYVSQLIENIAQRKQMGLLGRQDMMARYSLKDSSLRLLRILQSPGSAL